jgi:hypothetical protein
MILVRVVSVFAFVPERGELGGVDSFVVVKRTIAKIVGAQDKRDNKHYEQGNK